MINILTTKLPKSVLVNGAEIGINTDFRFSLKTILAFEDEELTMQEKIYILFMNLYGYIPEENAQDYLDKAIWFINCGETFKENVANQPRMYSFAKDNKYIYIAMKQSLNVNFDNLHWWDFVNYFMAIDENSFFARILYLRKQKAKGKLTKEEIRYWNENKDILELEDDSQNKIEKNEKYLEFIKLMKGE